MIEVLSTLIGAKVGEANKKVAQLLSQQLSNLCLFVFQQRVWSTPSKASISRTTVPSVTNLQL